MAGVGQVVGQSDHKTLLVDIDVLVVVSVFV
jgi:hypothetical protein